MNPYKPKILTDNRIQYACGCIEETHPDNLKGDEHEVRQNFATLVDSHQECCFDFKKIVHKYQSEYCLGVEDTEDSDKTDYEH